MTKEPTRDQGKFIVRMPEGMRNHLKLASERNGRSMNSEIVQRLEQSIYDEAKDDSDRLEINLPRGMLGNLGFYALVYDKDPDDYIISILQNSLNNSGVLQSAHNHISNLENEVAQLSSELDDAWAKAREWRTLLQAKRSNEAGFALLLKSTCEHILSYSHSVPAELREFAQQIIATLNIDIGDIAASTADAKKRAKRPKPVDPAAETGAFIKAENQDDHDEDMEDDKN